MAGPVYQATVELREEHEEQLRTSRISRDVGPPESVSAWWWLIPPAKWWLERRARRIHRRAVFDSLDKGELTVLIDYINKATGWMLVGIGGFFLAAKETWELHELEEWPTWLFWLLVVVMTLLCVGNAVVRYERGRQMVAQAQQTPPS